MKTALSTQISRDWNLEQSLHIAAELGYDGIELLLWEPHTTVEKVAQAVPEMKSLAAELCIEIPVVTIAGPVTEAAADRDYWQAVLELAAGLGAEVVKSPSAPPPSAEAAGEDFQRAGEAARECAAVAADRGLKLACETHLGMVSDTVAGTLRFLEAANSGNVYLTLDICNVYTSGDDPVAAVAALVQRTALLHVKDGKRLSGNECSWHPLGYGEVDFAAVLDELDKRSFDGWASIECLSYLDQYVHVSKLGTTDPIQLARHDLTAWRQLVHNRS